MNKKVIIGMCVVAICLIIGLAQMKGGYCTISPPPDTRQSGDEPMKVISLSEVQKAKERTVKPEAEKKVAEIKEVVTAAEAVESEAAAEKDIAAAEEVLTKEEEAAVEADEKSAEAEKGLADESLDNEVENEVSPQVDDKSEAEQRRLSPDEFLIDCAKGPTEIVQQALDGGLNVDLIGPQLRITPLMASISDKDAKRSLAKVKLLIKAGASPSMRALDKEQEAPLHLVARKSDSIELLDFLIASGADVNARDTRGYTPLMVAAMSAGILSPQDQLETLKALINAGADLNQTSNNGVAALSMAAVNASPKVLQLLIENGAKVNTTDQQGRTAAMVAVWGNSPEALKTLLDNGADLNLKDNEGQDIFDHVERHNNPQADKIRDILNRILKR